MRTARQAKPPPGLTKHAEILKEKIRCENSWKLANKGNMNEILRITRLYNSSNLEDVECLGYLIKISTANAHKLEEETKALRNKRWREHVAGDGTECKRGAFQYAKGPIGNPGSPLTDDNDVGDEDQHGIYEPLTEQTNRHKSRTILTHDVH